MITLIAAVSENNALGKDNQLLWHLPDDFKRFKNITSGHHIIMGRKTFESFPKPLPNRTHVIITRQKDYQPEACLIVDSLEKAISVCPKNEELFIIGGGEIYNQSIEMADKLFANTGLRKHTQKLFYDKFAAALAKEKPYGYVKDAQGSLKNALEPDVLDSVIRSAASDMISDRAVLSKMSPIDKDILRKKFLNWESKKDTPLTDSLKQVIFGLEKREMGGPVNSGQPYIVGEKGPELFVPRNSGGIVPNNKYGVAQGYNMGGMIKMMLMSLIGMQGGMALGNMSGLPGGGMIGSMLGSMLGMGGAGRSKDLQDGIEMPVKAQSKLARPMFSVAKGTDGKILSNYGAGLEKLSASKNVFAKTAVFAAKSLTRLNLLIGAGAAALYLAKNRYDAHKESMRLNALGYGMTSEAAEKAGLKFTNFNDKIKEAIGHAEALRERNKLLYESMNGSGTPLNITIEQYKKLKKEVKDNYQDQVLLLITSDMNPYVTPAHRTKILLDLHNLLLELAQAPRRDHHDEVRRELRLAPSPHGEALVRESRFLLLILLRLSRVILASFYMLRLLHLPKKFFDKP